LKYSHLKILNVQGVAQSYSVCLACARPWIQARCWWLTSVILATQEAEIRRIWDWSQPRQIESRPYLDKTMKKGLVEWLRYV
jgi:hypothetical protein